MSRFNASAADLLEATGYEVGAINEIRTTLHSQSEARGDGMAVSLGDYTPQGVLRRDLYMSGRASVSADAVRKALNLLRPLAFSAAFKIHDMTVEWILRANGVHDWSFQQKLAAYDSLGPSLLEPDLLRRFPPLSSAFWSLFRFFVPFRGSVVHRGGIVLEADSTVCITRDDQTLRLTSVEQGAYMRAMCLLVRMLTQPTPPDAYQRDLFESELFSLRQYHGALGLQPRQARLEILTVRIPQSQLLSADPVAFDIDFDELRQLMASTFPLPMPGSLYYSVVIVATSGERELTWELPVDAVPTGRVNLREGDPAYDRYLGTIRSRAGEQPGRSFTE